MNKATVSHMLPGPKEFPTSQDSSENLAPSQTLQTHHSTLPVWAVKILAGCFPFLFQQIQQSKPVCSMGFLLKPKVGKSYKHKNQQFICRIARHAYLEIELGNNLSTIHTAIIKCLETMSTRKAQDLYKQSSRVILKEVMENANKMENVRRIKVSISPKLS